MLFNFQHIALDISLDGIATLTLNRPDKLNTLSIALRQELAVAVDALQADPAIHVLILTGAGRAFTAGLDLTEWSTAGKQAAGAYEHDAVEALLRFKGPLIGAINGLAITGGLEIALACDVLIAVHTARFADTHVHVGLLPGWGGSVRLARRVGLHRAKELALTGRVFSADDAAQWGLVNQVVPADDLMAAAHAMARLMLRGLPGTVAAYKQLLDDEEGMTLADAIRHERRVSIDNNGPVTREAIDARLLLLRQHK